MVGDLSLGYLVDTTMKRGNRVPISLFIATHYCSNVGVIAPQKISRATWRPDHCLWILFFAFLQPQRICLWVLFPIITSDRDSGECLCQIPSFDVHSIPFRWADVYFLHKTRNKEVSPRAVKKCTKSGMHVQSCCFVYETYSLLLILTFSLRRCRGCLDSPL